MSFLCILSNSFFDFPSLFAFKIASWPSFECKYFSAIFSSFDRPNKPALIVVVLLLLRVLFLLLCVDGDHDDDAVKKLREEEEEIQEL